MNIVVKVLKVEKEKFYRLHLELVNALLEEDYKMVNKEIEVLVAFMSLEKNIIEEDMFNTLARKQVKEKLGNMTAAALSNHLKTLQDKGHISKNEITNRLTLNKHLIPGEPSQGYQIKISKI